MGTGSNISLQTFLQDYPRWLTFQRKYPGFSFLSLDAGKAKSALFENGNLEKLKLVRGFSDLQKKYGELETIYGIATLLGIGKGLNDRLQKVDHFIAKFSSKLGSRMALGNDVMNNMKLAVDKANAAVDTAIIKLSDNHSDLTKECLWHHFHIESESSHPSNPDVREVFWRYGILARELKSQFRVSEKHSDLDAWGNVVNSGEHSGSPYKVEGKNDRGATHFSGSIHVDYDFFYSSDPVDIERAAITIIHEGSHRWFDTRDLAYVGEAKYKPHIWKNIAFHGLRKIDNADSFAYFAMSLEKRKCLKSDL